MATDKPIVTSRLQKDWYYVTMGFFAWLRHRTVKVRWAFKNRSKIIRLPDHVDVGRLSEEIEHVKSLRYTDDEISWLRAKFHETVKDGFLSDAFLEYLRESKLSGIDYGIAKDDNGRAEFFFEPHGLWHEGMDWETFILPILTTLYGEAVMRNVGLTKAQVHANAMARLEKKIERLKRRPNLRFGSFGLRRQFSLELSEMIDRRVVEEIPNQLAGISNVWMAKKLGIPVIGTFAHQGPMVYSGIYRGSDEETRASHMQFFDDWFATFGPRWSTAVMDTFGSKSFYEDFGPKRARDWGVYKQDSGDPFVEARLLKRFLRSWAVDAHEKVFNPTDGLDIDLIEQLYDAFHKPFKDMIPGWGTTYSNDVGLPTALSIVIKASHACGNGLVKLSNNLNKASGAPDDVAFFKRIHGYVNTDAFETKV